MLSDCGIQRPGSVDFQARYLHWGRRTLLQCSCQHACRRFGRNFQLAMDVVNSRREKAVLVGCALKTSPKSSTAQALLSLEESLDELASLTTSAGGHVVERLVQEREQDHSAYLIGSGKLRELENSAREL